jgi:hypothetical protein
MPTSMIRAGDAVVMCHSPSMLSVLFNVWLQTIVV